MNLICIKIYCLVVLNKLKIPGKTTKKWVKLIVFTLIQFSTKLVLLSWYDSKTNNHD